MANLEQIVSRKAENDTKWKEAQQAERENTTAMQDAGITEITSNPEAYARYLEMQGDNPSYSAGNIALVMFGNPEATVFGTRDRWKTLSRSVMDSEKSNGVKIFARSPMGRGYTLADVSAGRLADLPQKVKALGWEETAARLNVGVPTLQDVAAELAKPGRDVRDELPAPILRTDVLDIKDLAPGMVLTGTVRNVVDFGVFVDIGVHQDGLVHISQVCNKFIRHPSEVVSVGDVVKVTVLEVDEKKRRISLSMTQAPKQ